MKKNVAILLFPDVEVLDFAGPFEVFAVTDELRGYATFKVYTVACPEPARRAETSAPIRARNGLTVVPDYDLDSCPPPHLLIIPGGFGTRRLLELPHVLDWVGTQSLAAELTMSVCTGSLVLAKAGLLDGPIHGVSALRSEVRGRKSEIRLRQKLRMRNPHVLRFRPPSSHLRTPSSNL